MTLRLLLTSVPLVLIAASDATRADDHGLNKSLIFFAGFDSGYDADLGDDVTFRTAESLKRDTVRDGNHCKVVTVAEDSGRFGDALRFSAVSKQVVLFNGSNVGFRKEDWSGTISFWLKLNPDEDLDPGFCDPLQITSRAWNDSALWVDFDRTLPRDFRMGAFPSLRSWNPDMTPWEDVPANSRPLVTVQRPPFSRERWTHIAMTFAGINAADQGLGSATLYVNGVPQGRLERRMPFEWDESKAAMMLGINYVGDFDELSVFRSALSANQVRALYGLPDGVRSLLPRSR